MRGMGRSRAAWLRVAWSGVAWSGVACSGVAWSGAAASLALPLLLAACSTMERTHLPTGQAVNRLVCSLSTDSLGRCYELAGEVCGARGYTIYHWDGTPWPKPYPDPGSMQFDTMLGSTTLLMACHGKSRSV